MKRHPDWIKESGEFVPMPLTFLNQERWIIECERSSADKLKALGDKLYRQVTEGLNL